MTIRTEYRGSKEGRNWTSPARIADYWSLHGYWEVVEMAGGWASPTCMRCGWRPVATSRTVSARWNEGGNGLERAHLVDHTLMGSGDPANVVMLCSLCHMKMPSFSDRSEALGWVDRGMLRSRSWQRFANHLMSCDTCQTGWPRWLKDEYRCFNELVASTFLLEYHSRLKHLRDPAPPCPVARMTRVAIESHHYLAVRAEP